MNIITKLTIRHLLENKKRTIVTILGIVASTALITAILVGVFSFFRFIGEINKATDGNVHAFYDKLSWEDVEALKTDDRIEIAGVNYQDPTISGVRMFTEKEMRYRVGNAFTGDYDIYRQLVNCDYEGTLPQKADEIAVEEQFLKDNGLDIKVGDTLTFELGNRYEYQADGTIVYYGGSYRSEEEFEAISTETCTVTAILHGNRPTKDFDILRIIENGAPISCNEEGESYLTCRITLKKADYTSTVQIKEIAKEYNVHIGSLNYEYLISVLAVQGMGDSYMQLFRLMGIALLIVMATSVVLIYNAFGMSLTEKIRYLGMLASVGATRAQKRASIYFEGLVLGFIGIPLGILVGIGGAGVTLAVLGKKLLESDIIVGAEGMRGTVPVIISPLVIVIIVVLSAITIFVSSLVPAHKASKIMPLDALRQTNTVKIRARRLRTNPLIKKIFGYEGELAYKNIKRNGLKGTIIVFSLAMSIILFLTINYFDKTFNKVNQYDLNLPFDIYVTCAPGETDKLKEELEALPEVDRIVSADYITFMFKEKQKATDHEPANRSFLDSRCLTEDYKALFDDIGSVNVVCVDDGDFNELLNDNGISIEEYYDGQLKGVILDSYHLEKNGKSVFNDKIIGQKLFYDDPANNPPAVEVAGIVPYDADNYLFKLVPKNTVNIYVPASMYFEKAAENIDRYKLSVTFGVFQTTDDADALYEKISDLTTYSGYKNCVVQNLSTSKAAMSTVSLMLNTAMYGFTILLTLIAVANIVNTISTAIHMRRQEFAMYKSVGMEQKGIKKMLLLETILYGIRALIIGIPASILLSYAMFNAIENKVYAFELNYPMYFIIVLAVFGIVGFSMLLSASKIKDDNIIEALKCDVI
ncbi:putative ABC transport system permease protein [Butyrivibrio fibrisolvens DSM 3071]|uniref:Putative ABC transport system permease protein n=1 Tax=Butyrivibrio fibrisolvens DSM 3071 TaxID=1121131 RepID=A0A1M6DP88_BUTFI|nr:FtsX-like permease family protein [Butyrivibrio fibrisolvens]SHI74828.1 putative ABC transport system permease protein [Butyrivibrio fibrisolvens DSM 3071]